MAARSVERERAGATARSIDFGAAEPAGDKPGKSGMIDRRARILQAATQRFAELGYKATTVRQIADDVNILSGSLYHHFATKEAMLHEIVRDVVLRLRDNMIRISKSPHGAEHRVVAMVLLELGELTHNQEVHAILMNSRGFFRFRQEFAYVVEAKKATFYAWWTVLQDGIAAKLFKPDIDLFLTILTITRMLNTAADWYKNEEMYSAGLSGTDAPYTLDKLIDFHLGFILNAIRPPRRSAEPIPRQACEDLAKYQA